MTNVHYLIHSFNTYLLSAYSVSDSVLVPGATAANKVYNMHSIRELVCQWEMKTLNVTIYYISLFIFMYLHIFSIYLGSVVEQAERKWAEGGCRPVEVGEGRLTAKVTLSKDLREVRVWAMRMPERRFQEEGRALLLCSTVTVHVVPEKDTQM